MDVPTVVVAAVGSLVMVAHGSRLAVRFSDHVLKFIVLGLMLVTSLLMVADVAK